MYFSGRDLGKRKGTGKTQDFVQAEEKEVEKHSIFNHARERELEKHGIFNHTRERELEKHGSCKRGRNGNWKSTACGRTFATRPAEVGFIIHYYGDIM